MCGTGFKQYDSLKLEQRQAYITMANTVIGGPPIYFPALPQNPEAALLERLGSNSQASTSSRGNPPQPRTPYRMNTLTQKLGTAAQRVAMTGPRRTDAASPPPEPQGSGLPGQPANYSQNKEGFSERSTQKTCARSCNPQRCIKLANSTSG